MTMIALHFTEVQDVRHALAFAKGSIEALSKTKEQNPGVVEAKQLIDDALSVLQYASLERERV